MQRINTEEGEDGTTATQESVNADLSNPVAADENVDDDIDNVSEAEVGLVDIITYACYVPVSMSCLGGNRESSHRINSFFNLPPLVMCGNKV